MLFQDSGFLEHLAILRKKLLWCLTVFLGCFILAFIFIEPIVAIIKAPLKNLSVELAYLKPQEKLLVYLKTAFFTGFAASLPVILLILGSFIYPALYSKEKKLLLTALPLVFISFLAGCFFSYFFLAPFFFEFLVAFAQGDGVKALWSVGEYFHLFFLILMMMGFVFQTPWILLVLIRLRVLEIETLSKYRRHIIIVIFIIAAVITPPDVYSQCIVGAILYLLFELTLVIAKIIRKREQAR